MLRRVQWSKPYEAVKESFRQLPPNQPGVYRIRAFNPRGRPMPIRRLAGTDPDGVLHIGQSRNIRARIPQFYRSARTGHGNHHAGNEFYNWAFGKRFPLQDLRFDYALAKDQKEAPGLERQRHEMYRQQYLDRPPLDGTSGSSPRRSLIPRNSIRTH
jgi:hypothetical protein